jgi:hypothetical protein
MNDDTAIAVIEEQADKNIRREFHDGRWFFSVIDVVAILTDSRNPRNYWNMLKSRMRDEGASELYTNCVQLKLPSRDGKNYRTDAADAETILRIVQSIPSPKAEPLKLWLAKTGAERLQEIQSGATVDTSAVAKPAPDASLIDWADYYEKLATLYRQQAAIETHLVAVDGRLDSIQDELESLHAAVSILPELLERLGPLTLTPDHQVGVKEYVKRLHDAGGFSYGQIYSELNSAFRVGTYTQIPDDAWSAIEDWFQRRIAAAERRNH